MLSVSRQTIPCGLLGRQRPRQFTPAGDGGEGGRGQNGRELIRQVLQMALALGGRTATSRSSELGRENPLALNKNGLGSKNNLTSSDQPRHRSATVLTASGLSCRDAASHPSGVLPVFNPGRSRSHLLWPPKTPVMSGTWPTMSALVMGHRKVRLCPCRRPESANDRQVKSSPFRDPR